MMRTRASVEAKAKAEACAEPASAGGAGWRSGWRRWLGLLVGVVLLAVAVHQAGGQVDWGAVAGVGWGTVGLLAGATAVNLVLNGILWWLVTESFGPAPPVGAVKMVRLIGASELLNHLPLRAGLLGRAAYLKMRHGLAFRQSAWALGVVAGLSVLAAVLCIAAAWLSGGGAIGLTGDGAFGEAGFGLGGDGVEGGWLRWWIYGVAGVMLCGAGPLMAWGIGRLSWRAWLWGPVRAADLVVNGVRIYAAFAAIGLGIDFEQALLAAAASSVVQLAALTPASLGVREWVIAWIAGPVAGPLVDRAVATVVVMVLGSCALLSFRGWGSGGFRGFRTT